MRKNNVIKFTALALLSGFALTACNDDIIAKPTGYDDNSPVVTIDGYNGTVENNEFTDIYDSIRAGNVASDVLDELLYQYATSVFGNYNTVTASKISHNEFGEITLKKAVKSLAGDRADAKAFILSHKAYWTTNNSGKRVDDNYNEVADNADPSDSEYARLQSKWDAIEKRIAKKLYSEISGGSYSEENVFEEIKYLRSLANSIENNVTTITDAVKAAAFKGVLTSKVEDYEVFTKQSARLDNTGDDYILHREYYQSSAAEDDGATPAENQDATYVEDKLIPDIYRQLLVEQYLLDESYDTLGRTSARQIDVISISKNSNYAKGANDLMNYFVKNEIFNRNGDKINLDTFKTVSNAWIGAFMSDPEMKDYMALTTDADREAFQGISEDAKKQYALMSASQPAEYVVDGDKPYFKGTAYGDMMEKIEKINDNPKLSENESDFTGSNSYTVEIGKEIKTRELELQDHTFTGWYIKSVGVSGLPDDIKNQLFDINVSNAVGFGEDCVEYSYDTTANAWTTNEKGAKAGSLINVVGKINDQYFLRNTTRIKDNPVENDILFEKDGTYYVVLVRDAIRSKTLDKKNFAGKTPAQLAELETYIDEIVQIVANNDTYKNLAKKHWLEEMNIKYHDSKVYDYFKSNFPELFD
ncbi:MAG: hypothetical protein J6T25_03180 [Bacilli bacterium]|nr:hypothetical protein [Bacilli bacterium]